MFSGIVENSGRVKALVQNGRAARLDLELPAWKGLSSGESICVNGVCLTLTVRRARVASFDLSPETLQRSSLGGLKPGEPVNLERALKAGDSLGGHFLSGHVDCLGRVRGIVKQAQGCEMTFSAPKDFLPLVAEKGSVGVEGVSLTCFGLGRDSFRVALVPYTLEHSNLGTKVPGSSVNLEADLLMRYVRRALEGTKRT
jgi:riboflavin synthase